MTPKMSLASSAAERGRMGLRVEGAPVVAVKPAGSAGPTGESLMDSYCAGRRCRRSRLSSLLGWWSWEEAPQRLRMQEQKPVSRQSGSARAGAHRRKHGANGGACLAFRARGRCERREAHWIFQSAVMTSNFQPISSGSSSPRSASNSRPSPHRLPYDETPHRRRTFILSTDDSSDSGSYQSPDRHHFRVQSASKPVKETRHARSEWSNSEDDGTSQLRINQYLIKEEIGRGSFGAVHLATDQYGHEFAVKEFSKTRLRRRAKSNMLRRPRSRMPPQTTHHQAPGFRALLGATFHRPPGSSHDEPDNSFDLIKEEIAIMKKLNHTNLVQLIEVLDDPDGDSLFMVLEMCKKGVIMKVEVDDVAEPYPEESCRMWFRDLILAIEYLHAQGVIHRDIKPDNCLLTDDDTLKVVDFGVSEMFEKTSEMRIAKSAGSPAFMAPELCTIAHGDVSGSAADIWSMGVTLYCMHFGKVPFTSEAVLDLYKNIVNDEAAIPDGCHPNFTDLMKCILEKDPDKRIKMPELREHPWVTKDGTDPLLPTEENCSAMVTPPTEDEMNAAITSNMARIMAIVVNRFKALLDKKRPDLVNSILGHASKYVKPPFSMSKEELETAAALHDPSSEPKDKDVQAAQKQFLADGDTLGAELAAKIDRLPRYLRNALFTESKEASEQPPKTASGTVTPSSHQIPRKAVPSATLPPQLEHSHSEPTMPGIPQPRHTTGGILYPGKGQAHDPLEDHLFLHIGQGPGEAGAEESAAEGDPDGAPIVCESPPATDFNVFERAYEEQVDSIRRERGRQAQIYLTRRVEAKMRGRLDRWQSAEGQEPGSKRVMAKQSFANVMGRAMNKANEYAAELEKRNEEGRVARQSPGLR
ncbi:hypothetical protein FH972_023468 [Carpinus fangiana]|uniref:Protein kinase domain-containing protein n=1 Tax=Carpinus fangiana TaxID=176857 RepID=A0A5N6KV94_9ROSI|nr:hypothetical protein FH972_023468 [Carpinus fangiana]